MTILKVTPFSSNFSYFPAIAAATSALVKAASAAQRELVDTGRVSKKAASDSDDVGQWSEGLVSAAQLVAGGYFLIHTRDQKRNILQFTCYIFY